MKHLYLSLALLFLLCQCTCHKQENDTQHNAIDSTVVDDIIDSLCVDETIIHTSLTDIDKSFSISKLVNHKDIHVVCDTLYEGFAPYLDNLKFYRNEHLLIIANFGDQDENINLNTPQHALNTMHLKPGTYHAKELLTASEMTLTIDPDIPDNITIGYRNAMIIKLM